MSLLYNRVQETTATTGTGSVTLAGAVSGYQSFGTALGAGAVAVNVPYCIVSGSLWEVGRGTYVQATGVLTRDLVKDGSSGPGVLITLAGTSNVFITASPDVIPTNARGYLLSRAMQLPI